MDSEAIRKKRQDDIEAKRRRLEEMRKSRQESAAAPPAVVQPTPAPAPPPAKTEADVKQETEELVKSLLTVPVKAEAPVVAPEDPSLSREKLLQEKLRSFSTVKSFNVIDILPSSSVKYEKACQTEEEDTLFLKPVAQETEVSTAYDQEASSDDELPSATPLKTMKSPSPSKGLFSNSKHQQMSTACLSADMEIEAAFVEKAKLKLPEEDRAKITAGSAFQNFLRTTSLYVERALALTEEHDVIRDFSVDEKGTAGDLDEHAAFILPAQGASSSGVSSTFEGEHLAGRPVMDLQWSHLVPELFLAAYGAKAATQASSTSGAHKTSSSSSAGGRAGTSEEDTPGMVCVWSKDLHSRPEYRFSASSPVLAAVFHSHEQSLVLGGCYSGQILLWDMKLNKALPVQRSSMSGKGHKHPVYAMAMTSSAVAAELVSVSTDGLLCHWDVSRLTEPVSVVQLHLPALSANPSSALSMGGFLSPVRELPGYASGVSAAQQSPLNISAMAFGHSASDHSSGSAADAVGSSADLIFGCGSGQLVRTPLPYKDNNPGAVKVDAHFGFITSIEPHPSRSSKYKHLLLSSSLDWTVKLWDLKNFAQPLIEFFTPSYDYVCDVQWSPVHPAVFVTVTSGGRISLWNLAKSSTEPVDALNIATDMEELSAAVSGVSVGGARGAESSAAAGAGARALNKVVWARDGLSVLCGDSQGTLHMLKLYPAAVLPSPQDEGRFELAIVSRAMEHSAHAVEESKMTSLETTPKKRGDGETESGMKASDSDLSFALE